MKIEILYGADGQPCFLLLFSLLNKESVDGKKSRLLRLGVLEVLSKSTPKFQENRELRDSKSSN